MSNALSRVSALASKQIQLEDELVELEELVKRKRGQVAQISRVALPEAMSTVEMESFKLADGSEVTVKPNITASITEANREAAFAWLKKHKLDGIIKHTISVSLKKGQATMAKRIIAGVRKVAPDSKPIDKMGVHAGTLKAFVREQLEEGNELPMDLFSVDTFPEAKIKRSNV